MIVTLGQARRAIAEFAGKTGKDPKSEDVRLFVLSLVQSLLFKGAHKGLRKWKFCLCNGCFTAPDLLELPVKAKLDGIPERVWSKWYEFYSVNNADLKCPDFRPGILEEVNSYYTVYDIPAEGKRVGVVPIETEDENAFIILQGEDEFGREIYTQYKGETVHGERLKISRSNPVFSRSTFTKITGIQKSVTKNYIRLYWHTYNSEKKITTSRGFLAEYGPGEEFPSYRRFRVPFARQDGCTDITLLGKIRVPDFRYDNDILPVENIAALIKAAQIVQAEKNKDYEGARYLSIGLDRDIQDENEYHKNDGEPFDFFYDTSPGAIENLQ